MQTRLDGAADPLAMLLQASPDAVVVVTRTGSSFWPSPAVKTLFGFDPDEIVGQPLRCWSPRNFAGVHERHRKTYADAARAAADGARARAHRSAT